MLNTDSPRHRLPFLVTGQSQKELTHNEALAMIDALLHPVVEAIVTEPEQPLAQSDSGKCWLVGPNPSGAWTGEAGNLACWANGSWRFLPPAEGMQLWNSQESCDYRYISGQWLAAIAVENVNGGNIVDIQARAAINQLLQYLRNTGQIRS